MIAIVWRPHKLGTVMPIQGQKYVILGGSSALGSALARALTAQHSAHIVVCDTFGDANASKWADLPVDVDDIWHPDSLLNNLDTAWREVAGVVLLNKSSPLDLNFDALLAAHYHLPRRVWDFCVAKQRPIYWGSSAHVYGSGDSNLSRDPADVMAMAPATAIGRACQAFDVFAAKQGIGPGAPPIACGFRLSSLYATSKGLPSRALAHAKAGTGLGLWTGSDEHTRDWIHVADAAHAMAHLMIAEQSGFFDIGTGIVTTNKDLIDKVEAQAGQKLIIHKAPAPLYHARHLPAANTQALADAGVSVQFRSLEIGLADL
jgi:ADP-L-glycero-D-manno-heptose 6-epimerase